MNTTLCIHVEQTKGKLPTYTKMNGGQKDGSCRDSNAGPLANVLR
jgi:hypothetical protein